MTDILDTLTEIEDEYEDDSYHPIRKFTVMNYLGNNKNNMFDTIEEAEEKIRKDIKRSPFSTNNRYIVEIRKVMRSAPVAETVVQELDVGQYLEEKEQKRLENEEDV